MALFLTLLPERIRCKHFHLAHCFSSERIHSGIWTWYNETLRRWIWDSAHGCWRWVVLTTWWPDLSNLRASWSMTKFPVHICCPSVWRNHTRAMSWHIGAKLAAFQRVSFRGDLWKACPVSACQARLGVGWLLWSWWCGHECSLQNKQGEQNKEESGICLSLALDIDKGITEGYVSPLWQERLFYLISPSILINTHPRVTHYHLGKERPTNLLQIVDIQLQQHWGGLYPVYHLQPPCALDPRKGFEGATIILAIPKGSSAYQHPTL